METNLIIAIGIQILGIAIVCIGYNKLYDKIPGEEKGKKISKAILYLGLAMVGISEIRLLL